MNIEELEKKFSDSLRESVRLHQEGPDCISITSPFHFNDGDSYQMYIEEIDGKLHLTDGGHTLMRLSFDVDIDKLESRKNWEKTFEKIKKQMNLGYREGEFYMKLDENSVSDSLFRFSQAITRIMDLQFLDVQRARGSEREKSNVNERQRNFDSRLKRDLIKVVKTDYLEQDYRLGILRGMGDFYADYMIKGTEQKKIFLFSIGSTERVNTTRDTLKLLTEMRSEVNYASVAIFDDSLRKSNGMADVVNHSDELIARAANNNDIESVLCRKLSDHVGEGRLLIGSK